MSLAQVSRLEHYRRWRKEHPEESKEATRIASKKWYAENKDKAKESQRIRREKNKLTVCDILSKHREDMKDDPERLTTEFLIETSTIILPAEARNEHTKSTDRKKHNRLPE